MTGERAESFLSFNVNILCNLFDKHQNQQLHLYEGEFM